MQQIIQSGTRAVSIYSQSPGKFDARLYVNCNPERHGPAALGEATLTAKKFRSLETALAWAAARVA